MRRAVLLVAWIAVVGAAAPARALTIDAPLSDRQVSAFLGSNSRTVDDAANLGDWDSTQTFFGFGNFTQMVIPQQQSDVSVGPNALSVTGLGGTGYATGSALCSPGQGEELANSFLDLYFTTAAGGSDTYSFSYSASSTMGTPMLGSGGYNWVVYLTQVGASTPIDSANAFTSSGALFTDTGHLAPGTEYEVQANALAYNGAQVTWNLQLHVSESTTPPVPEPASALVALAGTSIAAAARRRRARGS
jgi:hypothetical protein